MPVNALLQPLYGWLPVEQTGVSPWVWVPAAAVFLVRLGMDIVAWARWPRGKP